MNKSFGNREKQNDYLGIFLNHRNVNWAPKREHFQLSRREEAEGELARVQYLSQLDPNIGFYQVLLDNKVGIFASPAVISVVSDVSGYRSESRQHSLMYRTGVRRSAASHSPCRFRVYWDFRHNDALF